MINIVAVIDAEINGGKLRRFPNLACMKIAGYYKSKGVEVVLKTDYDDLEAYEKVYISKVFTKTKLDTKTLSLPNVEYGGTGFFYDKAKSLPGHIEHSFPDYRLYDGYVQRQLEKGVKTAALKCFTDYSIGFLTRGCFRKCPFCVNRNSGKCITHSPLGEFYDPCRKKIMLLDDNILAHNGWRRLVGELRSTGKPFTFKQGVDIRLVSTDFIELINQSKYDGELCFAFDDAADSPLIERKLSMFREHSGKAVRMYLFCAYDRSGRYDENFWLSDIGSIFKRLEIISKYQAIPYLMRYGKYLGSPYSGIYKTLATYCNVGGVFKSSSFKGFCENQLAMSVNKEKPCSRWRYYADFVQRHPSFETRFFSKDYWHMYNRTEDRQ